MTFWVIFGIFFVAGFLDRIFEVKIVRVQEETKKPKLTVIEGGKSARISTRQGS